MMRRITRVDVAVPVSAGISGGAWRLVRLEPYLNLTRVGLASPKL